MLPARVVLACVIALGTFGGCATLRAPAVLSNSSAKVSQVPIGPDTPVPSQNIPVAPGTAPEIGASATQPADSSPAAAEPTPTPSIEARVQGTITPGLTATPVPTVVQPLGDSVTASVVIGLFGGLGGALLTSRRQCSLGFSSTSEAPNTIRRLR